MHPSVKGWKNGWQRFGEVLLPLQEQFPEVIALMRYLVGMVSTNHSGVPASSQAGAEVVEWISGETAARQEGRASGVLFIPILSQSYCLGACLRIANEIHQSNPEIPIYVAKPDGPSVRLPSFVEIIDFSSLRKQSWIRLPEALARASSCWRALCQVLGRDKIICEELVRVYGNWKLHLFRWSCLYHYDERVATKFLEQKGIRSVVAINDVVKPAAPVISAGRKLGVRSVVLQHGTPGPQSAPFLADEGWVWGETSRQALITFGADSERLQIMGSLEGESVSQKESCEKDGPRVLLFLAQWRATKGWGEPFFQEVFDLLREVLAKRSGRWKLRVRLHPTDPAEAQSDIASRLDHPAVKVEFGKEGISMSDELVEADALLSVNSSGLMNGVSGNLPTAQILPTELEQMAGPALLNSENLLRDGEDLKQWLSRAEENDPAILNSISEVLANRGKVASLMANELIISR